MKRAARFVGAVALSVALLGLVTGLLFHVRMSRIDPCT
jgi:hypothetical protein